MLSIRLDDLNPAQRAAVLAPEGPILILAGAGSGKTRVLTYRIAYLLAECGAAPEQTLAVTFTNKAAAEMRERVAAMMGESNRFPWVSTFHALCARILRQEAQLLGYTRNFTILDESDSLATIRRMLDEAHSADSLPPEVVRARIDQAKNEAIFPEQLAGAATSNRERAMAELYALYQQRLREMNSMDFGDLLLLVYRLFETDREVLRRWQRRTQHLLVDEYQDTNRVQYLLVRALSAASGNLCVVGDEDQSIYRWRGADIRNILDFEHDFPKALIFKLEQNYRSTKTILAAAGAVIQHNRERKPKQLWTENASGEPVTYYTGLTERDEADYNAREIARLIGEGVRPADIVVFYRVNAQSRVLEEALVRRRLPYFVVGGLRFYDQREIKDLVAYLRVIANPADALSLERALGAPPRGIGAKTLEIIAEVAARDQVSTFEAMGRLETESRVALRIAKQASSFYSWMRDLMGNAESMPVRSILDQIVTHSGFDNYLINLADGKSRQQNLSEMLAAASAFDAEHGAGGLGDFLERVALVNDADRLASADGSITLMTLHTSKGLEYPVVFIAGMEEGLFPHIRPQDSTHEIEEERRLCYVGMTRARRLLYLTNALSRELYGNRQDTVPSRFLAEIDQALIRRIAPENAPPGVLRPPSREPYVDYSDSQLPEEDGAAPASLNVGAKVYHHTFGRGVIKRREGRGDAAKVWIAFERGGLKLLVLKFANLRAVAE
ncbi:MAG: UvrD-helicase domain-containing protein, partial [Deltaproteobacteria bacterium]|nr:UvrD-helicase domain-containing protein [Deltaproteobacteria bacterium]